MALLTCVGSGWIAWRVSDFGRANSEYEQAVADYKKSGLPWLASDLAQKPPVKDEDNAGLVIRKSLDLVNNNRKDKAQFKKLQLALSDGDIDAVQKAVSPLKSFLSLAREAADKPSCDYHRDLDLGPWLNYPELAQAKELARVLSASSLTAAKAGNTDVCLNDLLRIHALAEHAGQDRNIIGMLVRIAIDKMAFRGAERIADIWHDDPQRLKALLAKLDRFDDEISFYNYLKGESYMGLSALRNITDPKQLRQMSQGSSDGEPMKAPKNPKRSGAPSGFISRVLTCRFFQGWTYIARLNKGTKDPAELGKKIDEYYDKPEHKKASYLLISILLPVFRQAGTSITDRQAYLACTKGLVKVLIYRSEHGRFPVSLSEAGVNEIDPFDHKPLKFISTSLSCRVYSVGGDLFDDHGVRMGEVKTSPGGAKKYDTVASYPANRKKTAARKP